MNGIGGGGFGGGYDGGFDWNGNGHRDISDGYIDYELSNGKGGSGGGSNGGGNGGDGCLTTIGGIVTVLLFIYLLGSCS